MDLYAPPWVAFARMTLPLLAPALAAGWLLAFTLSLDDVVVASFTSGPGASTLPMVVFSSTAAGRDAGTLRAGDGDRWRRCGDPAGGGAAAVRRAEPQRSGLGRALPFSGPSPCRDWWPPSPGTWSARRSRRPGRGCGQDVAHRPVSARSSHQAARGDNRSPRNGSRCRVAARRMDTAEGNRLKAARSGLRPETRQGALPPGPPPEAAASGLHFLVGLREGCRRGQCSAADRRRVGWPRRHPSLNPNQRTGSKGRCPWRGSKGQRPLVGSGAKPLRSSSPWPCFPQTMALPCRRRRLPPCPCSDRFRRRANRELLHVPHRRTPRPHPAQPDHRHLPPMARHMIAEGKNVISLSQGEPDFDTPRNVKDAAIRAIEANEIALHRRRRHAGAAQGGGGKVQARQRPGLQAGGDHHLHRRQAGDLQRHAGDAERRRRGDHPQPVLGQLSRHRHAGRRQAGAGAVRRRTTASSCAPRTWKPRSRRRPSGSC